MFPLAERRFSSRVIFFFLPFLPARAASLTSSAVLGVLARRAAGPVDLEVVVVHRVQEPRDDLVQRARARDDADEGGGERGLDDDDRSIAASKASRDDTRGGDDKRDGAASDSDDDRRGERTSSLARFARDDAEAKP